MNKNKLAITFRGIADGLYKYDFCIQNNFFEAISYSEINEGNLNLHVNLEKRNNVLSMNLQIKGNVVVNCDRCLDFLPIDIDYQGKVLAKYKNDITEFENDEDIIVLKENDNEVDLTHYVYESILLSLPLKKVHGANENGESLCNQEMIKILNQHIIISE